MSVNLKVFNLTRQEARNSKNNCAIAIFMSLVSDIVPKSSRPLILERSMRNISLLFEDDVVAKDISPVTAIRVVHKHNAHLLAPLNNLQEFLSYDFARWQIYPLV